MFDLINGSQRERIDADEVARLGGTGCLVVDGRRSRPLWFDGRFLAARDLNREQDYFLSRQADLGAAVGGGVSDGLLVRPGPRATQVVIDPGHGVAQGGGTVLLPGITTVDLADVPVQRLLNRALGAMAAPAVPDELRSGLFVLALRPLEYSANKVGAYPNQPGTAAATQDGELIEATLITLLPFAEADAQGDEFLRRSAAARQIFADAGDWQPPANCLPLALLRLERNQVLWCDPWLVRRELGAGRSDILGLGLAPRAVRESFFRQYQNALDELLQARRGRNQGERFRADQHFQVLPPAGRLPAAAIDSATFTQYWLPEEIDCDLAAIPEDELATLVEESFLLPPIDLGGDAAERAGTAVLILVPIPRTQWSTMAPRLAPVRRTLLAPAPFARIGASPAEVLGSLVFRVATRAGASETVAAGDSDSVPSISAEAWRTLLAKAPTLWYVRRRNLARKDAILGTPIAIVGDDTKWEARFKERFAGLGLGKQWSELNAKATTGARMSLVSLFNQRDLIDSDLLTKTVVLELAKEKELDSLTVNTVGDRYSDAKVIEQVNRVLDAVSGPETKPAAGDKPAVDRSRKLLADKLSSAKGVELLVRLGAVADEKTLDGVAAGLKGAAAKAKPDELVEFLQKKIESL